FNPQATAFSGGAGWTVKLTFKNYKANTNDNQSPQVNLGGCIILCRRWKTQAFVIKFILSELSVYWSQENASSRFNAKRFPFVKAGTRKPGKPVFQENFSFCSET